MWLKNVQWPRWLLCLALSAVLTACAVPEPDGGASPERRLQAAARMLFEMPVGGGDWQAFPLPGKRFAPFEPVTALGRPALQVRSHHSVSLLRQHFASPLQQVGDLAFAWKVDALPMGADLQDAGSADAPVRILLAFEGDRSLWSARTHRLSELSRLLTGEPLPYATLTYVWSRNDPVEAVLHHPRTDRIRKLVVDSGDTHLGQWREHRRDVRADFIRAFGEAPGPLVGVALMSDTDNTASTLNAWYGAMRLTAVNAGP